MRLVALIALFWLGVLACVPLMALVKPNLVQLPQGVEGYAFAVPALLLAGAVFVYTPIATYFAARKRWETAEELREPRTYTFTDDGIEVVGKSFSGFMTWPIIIRAERAGGLVMLATRQQQFYLLPVKAFEQPETWARFTQLIEANVRDCRL
ncbi:YcxB family protein [Gemmata sp. G18]|uniref:YcxB family protein n=1 Tax=Gemmata palustris TaxID=2822762 RepID=A0ABS5BXH0_9BACT|nr:YcxB family protein [Gemmata palustris]MBP3958442.1 YcxB family protein [Gemmata palustris]